MITQTKKKIRILFAYRASSGGASKSEMHALLRLDRKGMKDWIALGILRIKRGKREKLRSQVLARANLHVPPNLGQVHLR